MIKPNKTIYFNGSTGFNNFNTISTRVNNGFKNSNLASSVENPSTSLYSNLSGLGLSDPDAFSSIYDGSDSESTYYCLDFMSFSSSNWSGRQTLYIYWYSDGYPSSYQVGGAFRPVITLKSDLVVKSGDGKTKATAYVLGTEN